MTELDAYDFHMMRHAKARGAVLVLFPTPNGPRTERATLLGWRAPTGARTRRSARVRFHDGAERTVAQADIILPDDDDTENGHAA